MIVIPTQSVQIQTVVSPVNVWQDIQALVQMVLVAVSLIGQSLLFRWGHHSLDQ